jgi:hypothetical protein
MQWPPAGESSERATQTCWSGVGTTEFDGEFTFDACCSGRNAFASGLFWVQYLHPRKRDKFFLNQLPLWRPTNIR